MFRSTIILSAIIGGVTIVAITLIYNSPFQTEEHDVVHSSIDHPAITICTDQVNYTGLSVLSNFRSKRDIFTVKSFNLALKLMQTGNPAVNNYFYGKSR